jgi:hypothetical protein
MRAFLLLIAIVIALPSIAAAQASDPVPANGWNTVDADAGAGGMVSNSIVPKGGLGSIRYYLFTTAANSAVLELTRGGMKCGLNTDRDSESDSGARVQIMEQQLSASDGDAAVAVLGKTLDGVAGSVPWVYDLVPGFYWVKVTVAPGAAEPAVVACWGY